MGRDSVIREYKKVQAAKKAQERARFLDKTKEAMNVVNDVAIKGIKVLNTFQEILKEEMTYTDKNGVKRTVSGELKDKEAGTLGVFDIFESDEFKGRPFSEVSRNMKSHFKMYCLVNGVSEKEMLSLADENPAPETLNKIRGLKEDFFQMVTNKDMDKISDMYVGIYEYNEKHLAQMKQCTNPEKIKELADFMIVSLGSGSYLQQTLKLNEMHRFEEQNELIDKINDKLAKKGKSATINDVEKTLMPIDNVAASLGNQAESGVKVDLNMDFTLEDMKNPNIAEDVDDEYYTERQPVERMVLLMNIAKKMNDKAISEGKNPLTTFSDVDYSVETQVDGKAIEVFDSVLDNAYIGEVDSLKTADDLTNRLANHHRTNMWGKVKANTPEYNNVLNQMKEIQKLEHSYAEDNATSPKNIQAAYEKLIKVTQKYLDERDPNSPAGKERYKLMLETMDLAKSALVKYKNLSNSVEAENSLAKEKVNCKEVEKEAVVENIVEQEKKEPEKKEEEKKEEKQVEEKKEPEKKEEAEIDQVKAAAIYRKLPNKFKDDEEFIALQKKVKDMLKFTSDEFDDAYTFSGRQHYFAGYVSLRNLDKRIDKIVNNDYSILALNEMDKAFEDIIAGKTIVSMINTIPFQKIIQENPFDNMDEKLKPIEELYDDYSAEANKEKTKVENKDKKVNKEANKGVEL